MPPYQIKIITSENDAFCYLDYIDRHDYSRMSVRILRLVSL